MYSTLPSPPRTLLNQNPFSLSLSKFFKLFEPPASLTAACGGGVCWEGHGDLEPKDNTVGHIAGPPDSRIPGPQLPQSPAPHLRGRTWGITHHPVWQGAFGFYLVGIIAVRTLIPHSFPRLDMKGCIWVCVVIMQIVTECVRPFSYTEEQY